MPDANLIQAVMYLMDCFLDIYRLEDTKLPGENDLRAQVEVGQPIRQL